MKRDFKRCGNLLRGHLIATVFVLVFDLSILSLFSNKIILTIITMLIYLSAIYLTGWNEGFRDSKKAAQCEPDIPRATKVAFMAAAVSFFLLILRIAAYHINPSSGFLTFTDVIYRLYHYYFVQFMANGTLISYIAPIIISIATYILGYIVGLKRFDFSEKILSKVLYKDKKKQ